MIGCKKFREKMDENLDKVDISINLFKIKLPLKGLYNEQARFINKKLV